jgi:hypothetical protein
VPRPRFYPYVFTFVHHATPDGSNTNRPLAPGSSERNFPHAQERVLGIVILTNESIPFEGVFYRFGHRDDDPTATLALAEANEVVSKTVG